MSAPADPAALAGTRRNGPEANAAPILSVDGMSVTFPAPQTKSWPWSDPGRVHAVNDVSFALAPGRTLGIVGESGCGKSTLIRAIAGLAAIRHGSVTLEGRRVDYADPDDRHRVRAAMQMIFQDPIASLNPRMTVREIVSEPLLYFRTGMDGAERRRVALDMLERVGIPAHQANRFPHEFSGGQCQRIGIARAVVSEPRILLCDEPVSALDVSIQAQVINLLRRLQSEMGLSMIFVAHDLSVVRYISDDILVMYMGGKMEEGHAAGLIAEPCHPYTRALLSAVPVPDPRVRVTPQILSGDLPSPLDLPRGCLFASRCPERIDACLRERPPVRSTPAGHAACLRIGAPDGETAAGR